MRAILLFVLSFNSCTTAWSPQPHRFGRSSLTSTPYGTSLYLSQEESDSSSSSSSNKEEKEPETLYQRIFYRFSPGSDVDLPNGIVLEERVRFQQQEEDKWMPVGHRTLLLRDGQVPDGEIGDEFVTLSVDSHDKSVLHAGAGTDVPLISDIATAMYLACNPDLCTERVLQVGCRTGLGALLGCMGAGFVSRKLSKGGVGATAAKHEVEDDILTIGGGSSSSSSGAKDDGVLPTDLDMLVLTDADEDSLNAAFHNCKHSGVSAAKISVEALDWRQQRRGTKAKEFRTVVASDLTFSYPEAKALARTVANRVQPIQFSAETTTPRFVHVCPDRRDDVTYLRRLLEQGYKMTVDTGYLKIEQLIFKSQRLPMSESEAALDDLELELIDFRELPFESVLAQHHPDYAGDGSGELFFPMETGEYEQRSGSTYMEPE